MFFPVYLMYVIEIHHGMFPIGEKNLVFIDCLQSAQNNFGML